MPVINTQNQIEVVIIPVTPDAGVHNLAIATPGGTVYRFQTSDGCIITRWGLTATSNRQVTPALDGSIFFFVFGMLPASITFDGIILPPLAVDSRVGDGLQYLNEFTQSCLAGSSFDTCACLMHSGAMLVIVDSVSIGYGTEVPGSRCGNFRIQMTGIPYASVSR